MYRTSPYLPDEFQPIDAETARDWAIDAVYKRIIDARPWQHRDRADDLMGELIDGDSPLAETLRGAILRAATDPTKLGVVSTVLDAMRWHVAASIVDETQ